MTHLFTGGALAPTFAGHGEHTAMSNGPLPKSTLGGVDSSPEAIAIALAKLQKYVAAYEKTANGNSRACADYREFAALLELVAKQRDEARAAVRASDAANQIGGLVGASAHDMHLDMERRLAEDVVEWKARAESASRQLAEARAAGQKLYAAYVATLRSGQGRITELGGDCDTVERMEKGDPALIEARAFLSGETK